MGEIKEIFWTNLEKGGDWLLVLLFFTLTTILDLYAIAKAVNIVRAAVATRLFTDKPKQGGQILPGHEPMVTIQISCFNEGNVIEDTINAACDVDWPKDKLCVQICDDSNDETVNIIESVCRRWQEKGVSCQRLIRPDRVGYKAGCLHYHTDKIQGDFVGMFDADHRCENQFLRRCVPHFFDEDGNSKPRVGLVQCPWAYYNTHTNILTEYDALSLDTAFVIEQTARSEFLGIFSFNGTGGIWRKDAIQAGGGWSWETITEDLDLSYMAYMAGYEFVYLRDLPQQLELPSGIRAHVQQKFRWTKGFFQVARKTLGRILRDPKTPVRIKFEVFFQYTGALAYSLTLVVVIIAPILSHRDLFSPFLIGFTVSPALVPLFSGTLTIFGKYSGSSNQYKSFGSRCKRLLFLPTLYAFALGMMVFETYAIYEGLTSDDATFVRTPKEGTPVAGDAKLDYRDDEDECRNDEEFKEGETIGCQREGDIEQCTPPPERSDEQPSRTISRWNCEQWLLMISRFPAMPRCLPKLSKKGQKFKTNFTNGMIGLLLGFYLCSWCIYLFNQKRRKEGLGSDITGTMMIFFLPLPSFGLFYVHGCFLYHLLSMRIKNILKKRNERKVKQKTLGRFHRNTVEEKSLELSMDFTGDSTVAPTVGMNTLHSRVGRDSLDGSLHSTISFGSLDLSIDGREYKIDEIDLSILKELDPPKRTSIQDDLEVPLSMDDYSDDECDESHKLPAAALSSGHGANERLSSFDILDNDCYSDQTSESDNTSDVIESSPSGEEVDVSSIHIEIEFEYGGTNSTTSCTGSAVDETYESESVGSFIAHGNGNIKPLQANILLHPPGYPIHSIGSDSDHTEMADSYHSRTCAVSELQSGITSENQSFYCSSRDSQGIGHVEEDGNDIDGEVEIVFLETPGDHWGHEGTSGLFWALPLLQESPSHSDSDRSNDTSHHTMSSICDSQDESHSETTDAFFSTTSPDHVPADMQMDLGVVPVAGPDKNLDQEAPARRIPSNRHVAVAGANTLMVGTLHKMEVYDLIIDD